MHSECFSKHQEQSAVAWGHRSQGYVKTYSSWSGVRDVTFELHPAVLGTLSVREWTVEGSTE